MSVNTKLTSISQVRELLQTLGIRPSRAMGQNFLVDANVLRIITQAAELTPDDNVLEIGGGLGVMTEALVQQAGKVVCVEKDFHLHAWLQQRTAGCENLKVIRGDMTELNEHDIPADRINKVVANLPYSVGNRILVDIFNWAKPPELIVVTVQQDVAARITAKHGGREFGLFSVLAQAAYETRIIKTISPSCFFPAPKIKSSVLKMIRRSDTMDQQTKALFIALARCAFNRRRKQMGSILHDISDELAPYQTNILSALETLNIPLQTRPEQISSENWRAIAANAAKQ